MYRTMLVAVDGSDLAEQALPHALQMAKCFNAQVHFVRVVMPFALLVPTAVEYDINENYRRQALAEAHSYLDQLEARYDPELGGRVHTSVLEGVVVDSILDYADFHNIDLIVMATHGRSGIGRWVFGSVAERVLHAAKVPVVLVRAQPEKKTEEAVAENIASN